MRGTGRLGDEAQRLRQILELATRHSLILLSESLSGTHAGESLYLSRDVVLIPRMLGARVVFATQFKARHSKEHVWREKWEPGR